MRCLTGLWLAFFVFAAQPFAAEEPSGIEESADTVAGEALPPPPAVYDQPDTVFNRINLTPDGVIAVDTFGHYWQYDFISAVFIPYQPLSESEPGNLQPVEERCTVEIHPGSFAREVVVGSDEYVADDIVALGRVVVNGWVQGNVTSVNDRVIVMRAGQVDGDIRAPEIEIRPGGIVSGEQTTLSPAQAPLSLVEGNVGWILFAIGVLLIIASFLVTSLMPRQLQTVGRCLMQYRWRTLVWGALTLFVLFPVVFAVAVISLVGLVVAPLVPLACFFGIAMGMTAWGHRFGSTLLDRLRLPSLPSSVTSLFGLVIWLSLWGLAVWMVRAGGPMVQATATIILALLALATAFPLLTGLGAALLTRFGYRGYALPESSSGSGEMAPQPTPPPLPEAPPTIPRSGYVPNTIAAEEKTAEPLRAGEPLENDRKTIDNSTVSVPPGKSE